MPELEFVVSAGRDEPLVAEVGLDASHRPFVSFRRFFAALTPVQARLHVEFVDLSITVA